MYQKFYIKVKSLSTGFQSHVNSLTGLRGKTKTNMLKQMNNFKIQPLTPLPNASQDKKKEPVVTSKSDVKKNFLEDIMKKK